MVHGQSLKLIQNPPQVNLKRHNIKNVTLLKKWFLLVKPNGIGNSPILKKAITSYQIKTISRFSKDYLLLLSSREKSVLMKAGKIAFNIILWRYEKC
jgi:hypothetical protein